MGGAESSQAKDFVEDALGNFTLLQLRQSEIAAIARKQSDDIGVVVEAGAFGANVVGHDKVGILGGEFFASVFRNVIRFGCESYDEAVTFRLRGFGQNIRSRLEAQR